MARNIFINTMILAFTMLAVAVILVAGTDTGAEVPPEVAVGQLAPETFIANRSTDPIIDDVQTEAARTQARANVETVYSNDNDATITVIRNVNSFFTDLRAGAVGDPVPEPATTTVPPDTTTPTTAADDSTSTSEGTDTTAVETTTTTVVPRRPIEEQIVLLGLQHSTLSVPIPAFVALYNNDLDRVQAGAEPVFPAVESRSIELLNDELGRGIRPGDLTERQDFYLSPLTRPPIFILGLPDAEQPVAREAIAQLVGFSLQANLRVDNEATTAAKDDAAEAVEPVYVTYSAGDTIVEVGEEITSIHFAAIQELQLYQPEIISGTSPWAMALLGVIAVMLAAFFLWRIAPTEWTEPRHMALLSILLILAALFSRIPGFIAEDNRTLGYVIPAVAIGFIAAILFDPRTAVLMAIPMAGFTAISTGDIAYTVYAGIATVIPVAFVSSVSSRRQLRVAVLLTAITVAPVAAAVEWLFGDGEPGFAALWAFLGALIAGLVSLGLVSFLEQAFGMTTALGLLDLLDRNHPALRLIEEQAPGTFNHSMLVGALAGRAARSIEADPLLAQAAAWYHDLGKTVHPQYFVENQFGVSNPHDSLDPAESAQIIRSHVTEGLKLAKKYRIPRDVADGIRMHHGTSLMRYFYNQAQQADPDVDPALFRHFGVKPQEKEMAIVMLSDAVEAAARAYSQEEDPTAEGLQRVVDSVVGEKVDDGQLDDSALTFGDLTAIKAELVLALMGYYHARVPYPGFPGPKAIEATPPPALPGVPEVPVAASSEAEE
jgi:putative nucleotidyltransferase with HDIG domain